MSSALPELPEVGTTVTVLMADGPSRPAGAMGQGSVPAYVCSYTGEVVEHSGDDMFLLKAKTVTVNGETRPFPDVPPVICHHSRWVRTAERLEYLRGELQAEQISTGELVELQSLVPYIGPDDTELLEAAGVPEHMGDAAEKALMAYRRSPLSESHRRAWETAVDQERKEACRYCGGDCPNQPKDSPHLCDGFAGDIDGLYAAESRSTIPNCPACNGERELSGTAGVFDCHFCGLSGP